LGLSLAAALIASSCSLLFSEGEQESTFADSGVINPSIDGALGSYSEAIANAGPIAYWRAEERVDSPATQDPVQGRRALDEMGQFHGSYRDSTELAVPGAHPGLGTAFRTGTTSEGSLIVPVEAISDVGEFSVELLFRPESQPEEQHGGIFIREQDEQFGFRFGTTENTGNSVFLKVWCHESGCSDGDDDSLEGEEVVGITLLDFDNWYHLVLVHQSDHRTSIFVNGEIDGQGILPIVSGQVSRFQTGFGSIVGKSHDASFDEMALYDRALSPEEVASHANAFMNSN
jgi:hypothetical protein